MKQAAGESCAPIRLYYYYNDAWMTVLLHYAGVMVAV